MTLWVERATAQDLLVRVNAVRPVDYEPVETRVQIGGRFTIGCPAPLEPALAGLIMIRAIREKKAEPPDGPASDLPAIAAKLLSVAKRHEIDDETFSALLSDAREKFEADIPLIQVDNLFRITKASDMPVVERLLLKSLAGFATRKDGDVSDCFPGRDLLADVCGISLPTLDGGLNELVARCFISKMGRARRGEEVFLTSYNGKRLAPKSGSTQTSNLYGLHPGRGIWWPVDSRTALGRKPPPPPKGKGRRRS